MSTLPAQKATAAALIAGYNTWDIDAMLAPRAPECVQQVLPASLGLKPHGNAEYRKYYDEQLSKMFTDFKVWPLASDEIRNLLTPWHRWRC